MRVQTIKTNRRVYKFAFACGSTPNIEQICRLNTKYTYEYIFYMCWLYSRKLFRAVKLKCLWAAAAIDRSWVCLHKQRGEARAYIVRAAGQTRVESTCVLAISFREIRKLCCTLSTQRATGHKYFGTKRQTNKQTNLLPCCLHCGRQHSFVSCFCGFCSTKFLAPSVP